MVVLPVNMSRLPYQIDHISLSPSPVDLQPRFFRAGILFDSKTYEEMLSTVYHQDNITQGEDKTNDNENLEDENDEEDEEEDPIFNEKLFDQTVLNDERAKEIQNLTQIIYNTQPSNDDLSHIIMQQLNDLLVTIVNDDNEQHTRKEFQPSSIASATLHPYPPVNQTGPIADHDRPYADYGHLGNLECAMHYSNIRICSYSLEKMLKLSLKSSILILRVFKQNMKNYHMDSFA